MLDDDEDYIDPPGIHAVDAGDQAGDQVGDQAVAHAKPAPIERFHRTAVGTAFAAGLLGLSDALEGRKDPTPAIIEDWAGGEPFKEPIVLRLDPDHPEDSIVMVRPWLKRERADGSPADD
ncbi:MAG: hypothetical protein QOE62_4036 [Actinomycetota bacterium]|nr:hypothetical protein [Actinomycetota bacterium]